MGVTKVQRKALMFAMKSQSTPKGDGGGHRLKGGLEECSETQKENLTKKKVYHWFFNIFIKDS